MEIRPRLRRELSLKEQEKKLLEQGNLRKDGYYYISSIKRCYLIWNLYNSNDLILPNSGCCIHHINEIRRDDRIENLRKLTRGVYMSLHHTGEKSTWFGKHHTEKTKQKIGTFHRNKKVTKETRKRISDSRKGKYDGKNHPMFGKRHSELSKERMSISNKGLMRTEKTKKKISKAKKGEKNPQAKTTEAQVLRIRKLWACGTYKIIELARLFDLTYGIVFYIVHRKSWKHI